MLRHLSLALILLLWAIANTPAATFSMVPMSDGTELATDVHLPGGEGPWPTIVLRSTYGRMGAVAKEWLTQNYAVVIQDVRGMGDSEGEAHVFYADGWREGLTDGADTVAWVKAQSWCNGKIATWGGSALAITEMFLAPTTSDLQIQHMVATPSASLKMAGMTFSNRALSTVSWRDSKTARPRQKAITISS